MGRDVAVHQTPRNVLHDDKDVQKLERRGDRDAGIAGHDRFGVIASA
jgi:hypothetical protein